MRGVWMTAAVVVVGGCGHSTSPSGAPTDLGVDALSFDAGPIFDPTAHVPKIHRPSPPTCLHTRQPGNARTELGDAEYSKCTSDADCTEGVNGRCTTQSYGAKHNECTYDECFVDADCGVGAVCDCRHEEPFVPGDMHWYQDGNRCSKGTCQVDADCGPGGWCSPSGGRAWYCHTTSDQCFDNDDCPFTQDCRRDDVSGSWTCYPGNGSNG